MFSITVVKLPPVGQLKRDLGFGETPWDEFTSPELLFELRRMYAALIACHRELNRARCFAELRRIEIAQRDVQLALRHSNIALRGIDRDPRFERQIHAAYFTFANQLMFDKVRDGGFGWMRCDRCGRLLQGAILPGVECQADGCGGKRRALQWSDLVATR